MADKEYFSVRWYYLPNGKLMDHKQMKLIDDPNFTGTPEASSLAPVRKDADANVIPCDLAAFNNGKGDDAYGSVAKKK
jgi:hypothetical protein